MDKNANGISIRNNVNKLASRQTKKNNEFIFKKNLRKLREKQNTKMNNVSVCKFDSQVKCNCI